MTGTGAAETTIGRLAFTLLAPSRADSAPPVAAPLDSLSAPSLADALGLALGALDDADPGAVWVVRRLEADVLVPWDVLGDQLAACVGRSLARAILDALAKGPGGNVVRFPSRAAHVAAFVAATSAGFAASWVFERFAGLRLLPPLPALLAAAGALDVGVADVIAELAAREALEPVLAVATPTLAAKTWAACLSTGQAPRPADVERVRAAHDPSSVLVAETAATCALRIFGHVSAALGTTPLVARAVDVVAHEHMARATRDLSPAGGRSAFEDGPVAPPASTPGVVVPVRLPVSANSPRGTGTATGAVRDGEVVVAPGASAFLVLPSLAAVGLANVGVADRTTVVNLLLGLDRGRPDAAVALAAGEGDDGLDDPRRALLVALGDDDRVGRRLARDVVVHPDGRRTVNLLRDVESGAWMAGTITETAAEVDWDELVGRVAAVLGPLDHAAEAEPPERDPRPDVGWLAPADDGELALALMARAGLRHLARRLLGFAHASMPYLVERFLPPGGVVAITPATFQAELSPAPLSVVLHMAGLDAFTYRVPWVERDIAVRHRR